MLSGLPKLSLGLCSSSWSPGNQTFSRARYVWEDPEANSATGPAREALDEARRFAIAIHGAALLYNLLLAERADALGLPGNEGRRDQFARRLDDWHQEVEGSDIIAWDLDQLWTLVDRQAGRCGSHPILRDQLDRSHSKSDQ